MKKATLKEFHPSIRRLRELDNNERHLAIFLGLSVLAGRATINTTYCLGQELDFFSEDEPSGVPLDV